MAFSKNEHSNSAKSLIYKRKTAAFIPAVYIGDANAIDLDLFLSPDYYQATIESYDEIKQNITVSALTINLSNTASLKNLETVLK